ncbi:MAG: bifunctional riboflavin kinase/FAD synthetase [Gammaproteobacteria bacterium]|nr:bifunctional riboflavin kinase/FAD synthetase [Gammaproteobacteria bacterium]
MAKLLHGIDSLSSAPGPSAVSIGNFDGVHLGHQQVINSLLENSKRLDVCPTVITFEPLAKEFFRPGSVARLTSLQQRSELMFELGVEVVICLPFTAAFAAMSAEDFVLAILVDALQTRYLSVGDDFRFGKGRAGDFPMLQSMGAEHGFEVFSHETFTVDGERVSSGRVRAALQADQLAAAAALLGRAYSISGTVVQDQQLGRTLDFPTANIPLEFDVAAAQGVYAVRARLASGRRCEGVANIGNRPTVDGSENRLEVHLFDFDGDLYGQSMDVELCAKIRAEQKFDSIEQLKQQIARDAAQARRYFVENSH